MTLSALTLPGTPRSRFLRLNLALVTSLIKTNLDLSLGLLRWGRADFGGLKSGVLMPAGEVRPGSPENDLVGKAASSCGSWNLGCVVVVVIVAPGRMSA